MPLQAKNHAVVDYLLIDVPVFYADTTVGQAMKAIRAKRHWDTLNYVYVLDESHRLIGVLSIKELLRASDTKALSTIMVAQPVGISASASQARSAVVAIKHNIKTVPVFKPGTREFLGVIGPDKILDVLHREHVEDMLHFSGIAQEHPTTDIFKASIGKLVRLRSPWLFFGLAGGMIATAVVGLFEETLRQEIALSFFIPVLVYISNAIAIQTQTLLIRLLSSQKMHPLKFLTKELLVSFILATFVGIVLGLYTLAWLSSPSLALTIGLAVMVSTLVAVGIATVIPLMLYVLKKDPALGSGPVATAIMDISTLVIYFLIAVLIIF